MKMGVFCPRSHDDPFEPVTLIEAYQSVLAQSGQLRSHLYAGGILWRSMGVICGTTFSITSVARI
jgi:hypothetical protein